VRIYGGRVGGERGMSCIPVEAETVLQKASALPAKEPSPLCGPSNDIYINYILGLYIHIRDLPLENLKI